MADHGVGAEPFAKACHSFFYIGMLSSMSQLKPEEKPSDPPILFIKPNAIKRADKKKLEQTGILIIEMENPSEIRFVRACAELESSEMLGLAAKAISGARFREEVKVVFADALCALLVEKSRNS